MSLHLCWEASMSGTDIRAIKGPDSSGAIVTAAGPAMHDALHDLALPTFRTYAETWNWQVLAHDLVMDGSGADSAAVQAKWAKVKLLREALQRHPYALWLDADVLLLRHDDDIRQHLHPDSFQALVLEHVPAEHRVNPNTGVWLLRSCPAAFAFLDAVQSCGLQPGPWADQGAVLTALDWDRGDEQYRWARPGPGNGFTAGTSWLPPGWNQPYLEERLDSEQYNGTSASYLGRPSVADPQALHFMGMLPEARYQHMARTYIAQVGTKAVA
jgi:galactosyl transferase GMA12/MNN10 family